jgi:hypothetical protein
MISAYKKRPHSFKRRLLKVLVEPNRKLLYEYEQHFLNMIKDQELGVKYYNLKKLAIGRDGPPWNKGLKGSQVAWNKGMTGMPQTSGFVGHKHTSETRAKISRPNHKLASLNADPVKCPYCGKTGGYPNMKRWHFENCKNYDK